LSHMPGCSSWACPGVHASASSLQVKMGCTLCCVASGLARCLLQAVVSALRGRCMRLVRSWACLLHREFRHAESLPCRGPVTLATAHAAAAQETTSRARKFLGPLDVPWSALGAGRQGCASPAQRLGARRARACYVSRDVCAAFAAMRAHRSQWVWFRWLFLWLSRYTYVNTLRAVSVADDL